MLDGCYCVYWFVGLVYFYKKAMSFVGLQHLGFVVTACLRKKGFVPMLEKGDYLSIKEERFPASWIKQSSVHVFDFNDMLGYQTVHVLPFCVGIHLLLAFHAMGTLFLNVE